MTSLRFEDGRALYKTGNYGAANLMFCKAIDASDVPPIKILDARAATREKLGDLKGAYEDAFKMTQLYSTNVRSYVRLGKVFEQVLQWDKARALYRYGISKVEKECDKDLLKERLEKAEKRVPMSKVDPCQKLPAELMICILQDLSFEQLVHCQRVSKTWRRLLTSTVEFWRHLDFSRAKKTVDTRALERLLANARRECFKITLNRDILSKPNDLKHLLAGCKKTLKCLDTFRLPDPMGVMYGLHQLTEVTIWARITPFEIKRLLKECCDLRSLQLYNIKTGADWSPISKSGSSPSRIENLLLRGQSAQMLSDFAALNDWSFLFPSCQRLSLIGLWYGATLPSEITQHMECLRELNLSMRSSNPNAHTVSIHLGSKLNVLRMESVLCDLNRSNYDHETDFLEYLSELTTLEIVNCFLQDATINEIISYCAETLRTIDLHNSILISSDALCRIMSECPHLRIVNLGNIISATDEVLTAMSGLEYLESVNLNNCKFVSGAGFLRLIKATIKTLKYINIKECDNVSSDSVTYARSLGVTVEYSFRSLQALKRKKVVGWLEHGKGL